MGSGDKQSTAAIGFLTVVRHDQHGLFGGYLLLNRAGRPLEFHCTAPVKPNRAQEILYGATLESYLYGEAIGSTLVAKSSCPVDFVCIEVPEAAAVREFIDAPVALVVANDAKTHDDPSRPLFRIDAAHERGWHHFAWNDRKLAVARRYEADAETLARRMCGLADHFDLAEPFERIRGAIEEAQRGAR